MPDDVKITTSDGKVQLFTDVVEVSINDEVLVPLAPDAPVTTTNGDAADSAGTITLTTPDLTPLDTSNQDPTPAPDGGSDAGTASPSTGDAPPDPTPSAPSSSPADASPATDSPDASASTPPAAASTPEELVAEAQADVDAALGEWPDSPALQDAKAKLAEAEGDLAA